MKGPSEAPFFVKCVYLLTATIMSYTAQSWPLHIAWTRTLERGYLSLMSNEIEPQMVEKARKTLAKRLCGVLDVDRFDVPASLFELANRAEVTDRITRSTLLSCETDWLPQICQYGIDGGNTIHFSLLLSTKKGNRLEETQIQTVEALLAGHHLEPIACTTYFYQTGAVMAVVFTPHHLANLMMAYCLAEKE